MGLPRYPDDITQNAFLRDVDVILETLKTSEKGLDAHEVLLRQERCGKNVLQEAEKVSWMRLFLEKFTEPLIVLLIISAAISFAIGEVADAVGIAVAVSLVSILGFIQEYRSEKSVEALKRLAAHKCRVVREGRTLEVLAEELVPGDIVLLSTGDRVPADLRLIETVNLQIDESILTGESEASEKFTGTIEKEDTLIADRKNMAYMGTVVTNGNGKGVVIATGEMTELGKISQMIQKVEERRTPLQQKLDQLGKQLSVFGIAIVTVIFVLGAIQGMDFLELFMVAVSLAVAAIPEGLPIVVTITLALGVTRMAKRNAIVRKLPAVEALGATTVICTDKTGTLTRNEMTVRKIYTSEIIEVTGVGYDVEGDFLKDGQRIDPEKDRHLMKLLETGLLCNNSQLSEKGLIGQPTEGALLTAALKAGLEDKRGELERLEEMPFDSEKKWMAVRYRTAQGGQVFVKGATEQVLEMCARYFSEEGARSLSRKKREEILGAYSALASEALRVLALAYGDRLEDLVFLGLAGIMDPPRRGVREAIKKARQSGVKVVMITGDSKETAIAVAKSLDFFEEGSIALSGTDVDNHHLDELAGVVDRVSVFYRVSPEHKMKIVKAFRKKGHIPAMTGDGVNDAPALKIADIGVAMGRAGTDVAKEAAEMILVDDNFATIVAAIEEGKSIYNNIKNFLRFELTTSIAALSVIASSTLLRLPLPLNPIEILWINIIMDGPPAQSLGVEPLDADVMKKPPRDPKEPVVTRRMVLNVLSGALIMFLGTMGLFLWELRSGAPNPGFEKRAMTMAFTVFVLFQMFNALNCRSEEKSVFKLGFFTNRYVLLAIAGSMLMQLAVIYIPFLQFIFDTVALSARDLLLATAVASSVFLFDEVRKRVVPWS
ncbi:MAG: calcium-transporting P-type ATPase, PMR1-type [Methanobacteriota archaeon]|nr:MAG: calcium-transporting P-type ATPase, PMR1-type [Euryarchaeota archaeon]